MQILSILIELTLFILVSHQSLNCFISSLKKLYLLNKFPSLFFCLSTTSFLILYVINLKKGYDKPVKKIETKNRNL